MLWVVARWRENTFSKASEISPTVARARVASTDKASRLPSPLSAAAVRSEEHTSELQSLMRISYAVFCLKKKTHIRTQNRITQMTMKTPNKYTTIDSMRD